MQKLIALFVFIILISLVLFYFYLESRYYVCPDGKLVDFDFQCEKYNPEKIKPISTNLTIDTKKIGEETIRTESNIVLKINPKEREVLIYFSPNADSEEYKELIDAKNTSILIRYQNEEYFFLSPPDKIYLNKESDGIYYIKLFSPKIPGRYILNVLDYAPNSEFKMQNLTVIGQTNETLAYAIVDRQLYTSFGSSTSFIRNWTTTSKYILDKGNFYETYMENSFDFCDIGVRNFICESKTVSGKFQISKETGQIIG